MEDPFKPVDDSDDNDPLNSPDPDKRRAALQAELQSYHKAMEEEWSDGVKYEEGKLTPQEIKDRTKELLTQAVPKAVAALLYLCQHAKAENVQLKAASYIIDKAVGKDIGNLVGDPIDDLLRQLAKTTNETSE